MRATRITLAALLGACTPRCEGPVLPWDATSRAQANDLVTRSLAATSTTNPLGLADAAAGLHAEGRTYFVVVPEGVIVPRILRPLRVDAWPTPCSDELDTPAWSRQIEIVDRIGEGSRIEPRSTAHSQAGQRRASSTSTAAPSSMGFQSSSIFKA
jgi:hypothetical protein